MILPEFISLSDWADSLVIAFPDDNVPFLTDEENWKEWGDQLVQENSFINNNAPGTSNYTHWKDWATDVYFVMNNNSF